VVQLRPLRLAPEGQEQEEKARPEGQELVPVRAQGVPRLKPWALGAAEPMRQAREVLRRVPGAAQ
jgi:hypothetical protein